MQFFYLEQAGDKNIIIKDELYRHIFKSRREKNNNILKFRNLIDDFLYEYKIINISKKEAILELINQEKKILKPKKYLHIGWCIIDPKEIERTLPFLNEIGVSKITFIYCKYSQKNFKLNFSKLKKILINSSSQCGRSSIITLEQKESLKEFLNEYSDAVMLNFSKNSIKDIDFDTIVVGPEGGFCKEEVKLFNKIAGFDSDIILKSQSATVAVSSMKLL